MEPSVGGWSFHMVRSHSTQDRFPSTVKDKTCALSVRLALTCLRPSPAFQPSLKLHISSRFPSHAMLFLQTSISVSHSSPAPHNRNSNIIPEGCFHFHFLGFGVSWNIFPFDAYTQSALNKGQLEQIRNPIPRQILGVAPNGAPVCLEDLISVFDERLVHDCFPSLGEPL